MSDKLQFVEGFRLVNAQALNATLNKLKFIGHLGLNNHKRYHRFRACALLNKAL
jgi:hypothetical protein